MNIEENYSKEQMSEAIDLIVNENLTITTASNLYGVPCKVLRENLHKQGKDEERRPRRGKSSDICRFISVELSEESFKKAVKRAKKYLSEKHHNVKLGEVYHVASLILGYNNWNSMTACGFHEGPQQSVVLSKDTVDENGAEI